MIKFTRKRPINIEDELPEFAKAVKQENADTIIMSDGAFSESELELLGSAIKYACKNGKKVTIVPQGNYQSNYLKVVNK